MKSNIKLFSISNSLWSKFLDSNPQLFRELQGKLKTRNVVTAAAIAVIVQFILVIVQLGKLPEKLPEELPEISFIGTQCGRYGTTLIYAQKYNGSTCYALDEARNWLINWQLWWLDLFIILSLIIIIALLVIGSYLLIVDLVQEEERGTLNFIRLTPQSAGTVLLGKLLGVPIVLYTAIAFCLPLFLVAGLQSQIPLTLILAFALTVVASCAFCYSLALLWSLLDFGPSGFKSWFAGGVLGFLLLFSTFMLLDQGNQLDSLFSGFLIFHPGIVLSYLIDASDLLLGSADFMFLEDLGTLSFFGQALWTNSSLGISLIVINFSLWTYWCWAILKRRFHNPQSTPLSKAHSYWLTAWFTLIALGFTLQQDTSDYYPDTSQLIAENFIQLQICLSLFGLGLIFALSPHRQSLFDWARYRHQNNHNSLGKELVLGNNSPAVVAIAINLAIAIVFISPSIFFILPYGKQHVFWGLLLGLSNVLFYGIIAQLILMSKNRKRVVWSITTVASMIILPPLCLGVAELPMQTMPQAWLFSFVPIAAAPYASSSAIAWALAGQWLTIVVISLQITRKLKQAGASETKILSSGRQILGN